MTKINALIAFSVMLASSANASTLIDKSLRIKAPNDGFSKCVADQAVEQVISKLPNLGGYQVQSLAGAYIEGNGGTSGYATLDFMAGTPSTGSHIFTVYLRSSDFVNGWVPIHTADGEVYPRTSSVDSASVVHQWNKPIGRFDFSACK